MRAWSRPVFTLFLTSVAAPLAAQDVVRGHVLDADGAPLPAAVVRLASGGASAVAGVEGAFTLALPAAGSSSRLVAERLGFAPETLRAAAGPVEFRLRASVVEVGPLLVQGERSYSAASSADIRRLDLALRPRASSQELLRLVPGLVIAQHAGGGKAEQIFLRGFDADHGTDVAVSVDGTPVNIVSHAHGQGYADLHFLIPEVVSELEVRKGPFDARDGDFATAGAVLFRTLDRVEAPTASLRGGSYGTGTAEATLPFGGDSDHAGGYLALAGKAARGPFDRPQDHRASNAFLKWSMPLSAAEVVASASGYGARWDASGQIPERAVRSGRVDRFGSLDPSEGGETSRLDASLALRSRADHGRSWEARAWAARYRFDLFSDFTFLLQDSIHGDGIEQQDARWIGGVDAHAAGSADVAGREGRWSLGAGGRVDEGRVGLYHQQDRVRLDTRVDDRLGEDHLYAWSQEEIALAPRLRLQAGVRADALRFGVRRLGGAATCAAGDPGAAAPAACSRWLATIGPRAALAWDVAYGTSLFADAGSGFHSNDARDVLLAGGTRSAGALLPRALSSELGARHSWDGGSAALSLWGLDLASELVYDGDTGSTEAAGRTRRFGAEGELRLRLVRWLWADADLALARGRFRDAPADSDRIPLAPRLASSGGLTARDLDGWTGGLRYRGIGSRQADETGAIVAHGYTIWELFGRRRLGPATLVLTVDNLFDRVWNEAQFATTSRLAGESAPVTELHFTPGAPRSLQAGLEWKF